MRTLGIFLFLSIFFTACQNSPKGGEEQAQAETPEMKYKLTPFAESAAFPDAKIEDMKFENGKFKFAIGGESYKLGVQTPDAGAKMCANSAEGQHIHLIVDNEPYAAKYQAEFDYEIPDGSHYLLAFLSRSYHESIKTQEAFRAEKVMVSGNTITESEPASGPMLFYSRPKGTYTGKAETEKVMLDFYLVNASMGEGYKVKADINGETHLLDSWQPYYIEGLPMGENTITLTLVDREGNPVQAPLNPVSRTFTLQEDPAPAN